MSSGVLSAKLYSHSGDAKGAVEVPVQLVSPVVKSELIHNAIRWQRAKRRAGTHDVLTRSEIKGGAKKPFKQKGTGNARAGSTVSPLMVGGAVVHGPTPRSYAFRLSKKMRRGALTSAFAVKFGNQDVIVIDSMQGVAGRTKQGAELLKKLGLEGEKVMVIVPNEATEERTNFMLGLRNIPRVNVVATAGVNVYDLINAKKVVCVNAALRELEARVSAEAK